jgi:penicillin-binding protein 2
MNSYDLFGNRKEPLGYQEAESGRVAEFSEDSDDLAEVDAEQPPRNFNGLALWLLGTILALGVQCYRLQVTQGSQYIAQAQSNSLRVITVQPERGLIVDDTGKTLAQNTRQEALAINPETMPAKLSQRKLIYGLLESKAGIDAKTIAFVENEISQRSTPDIFPIKTDLTEDQSLLYKEWFANTPGVVVQASPIRQYAELSSLGQLVGYVGQANTAVDQKAGYSPDQRVGRTGLEQTYDAQLQGAPGKEKAEVDAYGDVVRELPDSADTQAKPGDTLKLSLDSNYQTIVANALNEAIQERTKIFGGAKTTGLGAAAVILDPKDGAIKAMVSLPDYDANLFASGITQTAYQGLLNDPGNPLLNRAIQGLYPSGSTIKPLIAAAALQTGIIDKNKTVVTPDAIYVGSYRFPDWKQHGSTDVEEAIAQSNDVFFYAVGGGYAPFGISGLGITALDKGLQQFGLGSPTGVDLPGEAAGLVATPAWKQKNVGQAWYIGDTYHQSIGQGYLLVTPLQMAAATAAIANGGTLYQPQLGWSLTDPATGKEELLPHKVLNAHWISPANIQTVQQGMQMTSQPGGTAQVLTNLGVSFAGKTGTAQFGTDNLTHSWFIGYAPAQNPTIAFAVLIEGDGDVTEATEGSEPVVEEILRGIFNLPLQAGQPLLSAALLPQAPTTSGQ